MHATLGFLPVLIIYPLNFNLQIQIRLTVYIIVSYRIIAFMTSRPDPTCGRKIIQSIIVESAMLKGDSWVIGVGNPRAPHPLYDALYITLHNT